MMIPRLITKTVIEKLRTSNKGVVIYGARQVGKTTLANEVIAKLGLKTLAINGDQSRYIEIISSRNLDKLRSLVTGYELLLVDEAQRIPEIGLNLKIILDNLPWLKVLVTGSSAMDLASKISEPLTGRVWNYHLFPISWLELAAFNNQVELDARLEERMIFGSYPELFSLEGTTQRIEYLRNLSDAYLYRDLLEFGNIKNSAKIRDLLKLLAFQVGSEVSLTEFGMQLQMGKDTVARYIDLLEKSFIVFRVKGFNRNLRKEVSKMDKIYFNDLGVRNILIDNLKGLKDRNDGGQLWENLLMVERMKLLAYRGEPASAYFWRTHTGAELDYVEEKGGRLYGYDFKFGKGQPRIPKAWGEVYPGASYELINRDNYGDFLTGGC